MTERVGVCQQCNARFKIPATFQGTKAKCAKCGGTVMVGAAGPAATPAAPKAAPAAQPATPKAAAPKAAGAAPAGSRAARPAAGGRNAGARGARTRPGRAGRAGHADDDAPAKSNNAIFIGIGVAVLAIGAAAVFFMTKGDDKPIVPVTSANAATGEPKPTEAAPVTPPTTEAKPAEVAPPVEAPKEEPKKEEPKVEAPPVVDTSSPVLKVEPLFTKLPESTDEQWTAIQDAVKKVFLESAKPKERTAAKKVLDEAGLTILPALMNALNGLDLSNDIDLGKVNAILMRVQETTNNVMGVSFDGDAGKIQENLANNIKASNKLITAWRKYEGEAGVPQFEKLKEKVAAAAEGGESEGG